MTAPYFRYTAKVEKMQIKDIKQIHNPLTIIAIFAGIAEISGSVVLPFINAANQQIFVFFLIGFPLVLVLLFFITLNFNHRVLYSPSDFSNEQHFVNLITARFSQAESDLTSTLEEKIGDLGATVENDISNKISILERESERLKQETYYAIARQCMSSGRLEDAKRQLGLAAKLGVTATGCGLAARMEKRLGNYAIAITINGVRHDILCYGNAFVSGGQNQWGQTRYSMLC